MVVVPVVAEIIPGIMTVPVIMPGTKVLPLLIMPGIKVLPAMIMPLRRLNRSGISFGAVKNSLQHMDLALRRLYPRFKR